jgi:predicted HD phosphohydrolase|tara:strand:+ start:58 stop:594 length:537 start_codon:yes stop_codon:yes gene_type:complete
MHILDKIISNFKNNKSLYIGEKITMSEHMIQTAMLAEKAKSNEYLVCSCLLHDYGHFIIENPDELVKNNKDGNHESIGYEYLKNFFKEETVEPIKYHVLAKRYLARNKKYYNHLSDASKISLKLQGGILNKKESNEFEKMAYFKNAIKVRKFDELAKKTNVKIKSIDEYKDLLNSQLL